MKRVECCCGDPECKAAVWLDSDMGLWVENNKETTQLIYLDRPAIEELIRGLVSTLVRL